MQKLYMRGCMNTIKEPDWHLVKVKMNHAITGWSDKLTDLQIVSPIQK